MPKSYHEYDSWKGFQEYFPERTQIKPGEEPEEEYWDWKDYHVHIDRYIPTGDSKDIKIILVHGGGANGRLMFPMGVVLRSNGYECISADFPGFGLTEIRKPNSYFTWIDLVVDLIEREKQRDGKPVVLCGISLGGMLSYQAACRSDVKGVIASALADTRKEEVQKQLSKNWLMGSVGLGFTKSSLGKLADSVKIPIKSTTKMWAMANNPDFVKKLMKDKVGSGSKVYVKFLRTLFEAGPDIEPELFEVPILMVQPEIDHIIPWWVSKPFYERLGGEKSFVELKGCGHIPLEEPGISQLEAASLTFLAKIEANL